MGIYVAPPFSAPTPEMRTAVAGAGYFQLVYNAGVNLDTGELTVNFRDSDKELTGSIGQIMLTEDFEVNTAPIGNTEAQLNLAFAFGYLAAQLEQGRLAQQGQGG